MHSFDEWGVDDPERSHWDVGKCNEVFAMLGGKPGLLSARPKTKETLPSREGNLTTVSFTAVSMPSCHGGFVWASWLPNPLPCPVKLLCKDWQAGGSPCSVTHTSGGRSQLVGLYWILTSQLHQPPNVISAVFSSCQVGLCPISQISHDHSYHYFTQGLLLPTYFTGLSVTKFTSGSFLAL